MANEIDPGFTPIAENEPQVEINVPPPNEQDPGYTPITGGEQQVEIDVSAPKNQEFNALQSEIGGDSSIVINDKFTGAQTGDTSTPPANVFGDSVPFADLGKAPTDLFGGNDSFGTLNSGSDNAANVFGDKVPFAALNQGANPATNDFQTSAKVNVEASGVSVTGGLKSDTFSATGTVGIDKDFKAFGSAAIGANNGKGIEGEVSVMTNGQGPAAFGASAAIKTGDNKLNVSATTQGGIVNGNITDTLKIGGGEIKVGADLKSNDSATFKAAIVPTDPKNGLAAAAAIKDGSGAYKAEFTTPGYNSSTNVAVSGDRTGDKQSIKYDQNNLFGLNGLNLMTDLTRTNGNVTAGLGLNQKTSIGDFGLNYSTTGDYKATFNPSFLPGAQLFLNNGNVGIGFNIR
jgi:hypothetical protein